MGFMDKLKAVKNMVTGGGAEVSIEVVEPALEEEFDIKVTAVIGEADISVNRVYLKIKSVEEVVVRDIEVAEEFGDELRIDRRDVYQTNNLFEAELDLAGEDTLEAGQEYTWETSITLSDEASPTFEGYNANHTWYFMGALDTRGNDPDSGWVEAELY